MNSGCLGDILESHWGWRRTGNKGTLSAHADKPNQSRHEGPNNELRSYLRPHLLFRDAQVIHYDTSGVASEFIWDFGLKNPLWSPFSSIQNLKIQNPKWTLPLQFPGRLRFEKGVPF